jgi:NAD(P)-dependent dehydrogenase (short-subunit alcohol dehydrogenase family)
MSLRPFAGLVWRPGRGIRPLSANDKQILITGATNGIGLAAAEALAALGANLAIVGRSKTRTRIASARIRVAAVTVAAFIADLSSQASVRRLATEVLRYPKLDVLGGRKVTVGVNRLLLCAGALFRPIGAPI